MLARIAVEQQGDARQQPVHGGGGAPVAGLLLVAATGTGPVLAALR